MGQLSHVRTQFGAELSGASSGGGLTSALTPAEAAQMVGLSALLARPADGSVQEGVQLYSAGAGVLGWMRGAGAENLLIGGMLSDRLVFRAEDGRHHVSADLKRWDLLVFESLGLRCGNQDPRADALPGVEGLEFTDSGGSGLRLVILGATHSDLHSDMFLL